MHIAISSYEDTLTAKTRLSPIPQPTTRSYMRSGTMRASPLSEGVLKDTPADISFRDPLGVVWDRANPLRLCRFFV